MVQIARATCINCGDAITKVEGFGWRHCNGLRYECSVNPHAEPEPATIMEITAEDYRKGDYGRPNR